MRVTSITLTLGWIICVILTANSSNTKNWTIVIVALVITYFGPGWVMNTAYWIKEGFKEDEQ